MLKPNKNRGSGHPPCPLGSYGPDSICRLSKLRTRCFKDAQVKRLDLSNCLLHEISAKAFKGLERNLEMLDLSANRLKDLPDTLLDDFDLIKEVILSENMLSLLPNVSFNGFRYSIKELYLLGEDMNYVPLNQACSIIRYL